MFTNTNLYFLAIGGQVVPGYVRSVIHNGLHRRRGVELARYGNEVKDAYQIKRTIREKLCLTPRERKRGRKSKFLTPIPGQDVDIPLVVGGALVVGEATFSPLTGGVNVNDSSLGPSIGISSYDDATIGDNTVSRETNDELIQMLNDIDAN